MTSDAFAQPAKTTVQKTKATTTLPANDPAAGAAVAGTFAVGGMVCIIVGIISSIIYTLLPIIIAVMRGHNNIAPIALIVVFLGWTGIGWIVAMIWAFTNDTSTTDRRRYGR